MSVLADMRPAPTAGVITEDDTGRHGDGDGVVSGRPDQILHYLCVSCAGQAEDCGRVSRIIANQHHIGRFHRHIGACADGDSKSASTSAGASLTPSPIMAT